MHILNCKIQNKHQQVILKKIGAFSLIKLGQRTHFIKSSNKSPGEGQNVAPFYNVESGPQWNDFEKIKEYRGRKGF